MRDIAPCKDCSDRCMGCHGSCTRYAEWHARHIERLKNEHQAHRNEVNWTEHHEKNYRAFISRSKPLRRKR